MKYLRTICTVFLTLALFGVSSSRLEASDKPPLGVPIAKRADAARMSATLASARPIANDSASRPLGYYSGDPLPPKTVYLTFDDGPWDFTGEIVDILQKEGVRATFFMNSYDKDNPFHADTGKNLMFRFADVLKRLVANGNVIGNHTYSHQDLARLSPRQIDFQLSRLERQLAEVLGPAMPKIHLFRPPFGSPWLGHWNTANQRKKVAQVVSGRYFVMMWTVGWDSKDSLGWAPGEWYEATSSRYHPGNVRYDAKMEKELNRILKHADTGASGIILMHDTHPTSRDILKPLIEQLKKRGYSFGTLDDYCRWRWGSKVFLGLGPSHPVDPVSSAAAP